MKKAHLLFLALCVIANATPPSSPLIKFKQGRDLRLLLNAPEREKGTFLLDTSRLNFTGEKSAAYGQSLIAAPINLGVVIKNFKENFPDDYFLSKQSTVVVFSRDQVLRLDLYKTTEQELSSSVINEGDIVIIGNFGDYL